MASLLLNMMKTKVIIIGAAGEFIVAGQDDSFVSLEQSSVIKQSINTSKTGSS